MKALTSLLVLIVAAAVSNATPIGSGLDGQIDFRTGAYSSCDLLSACAISDPNTGFNLNLSSDPRGMNWTSGLGFGILGGTQGDEIDNVEVFTVSLGGLRDVTGVYFTKIFDRPDGIDGETAVVRAYNGNTLVGTFSFTGNDPIGGDGEFYGALNVSATRLVFTTTQTSGDRFDEFAVAGITVRGGSDIPEPSTMALLGLGLAGFALVRHRK
jgi:hypothetical protein